MDKSLKHSILLVLVWVMLFGCVQNDPLITSNSVSGNLALTNSSGIGTGIFSKCYTIDDSNVNGMVAKVNCQIDIFFSDKTVDYCANNNPSYTINKETNLYLTTRDQSYERLAISKKDVSICTKISMIDEISGCYDYIAQAAKDKTICSKISDTIQKQSCERRIG